MNKRAFYKKMNSFMDKINKLSLPVVILIASIILGGFYYASQVNKQKSIEKQQMIKLQDDRRIEEAKAEQANKEYVAKRKIECYDIYEKEGKKFNNVENFGYVKSCGIGGDLFCQDDSCEIIYKDNDTGKYFRKYY